MTARQAAERRGLAAPASTAWGYVRHELLFLCFALMEIALLTPVLRVILGWAYYWPAYQIALWLLLVMLLPLNLIRLMSLLHFEVKRQRQFLIGALLLTIVLSWRLLLYTAASPFDLSWLGQFTQSLGEGSNLLWTRDVSVFLVSAFIWWRGIRLAIRYPEINNVGLRLRLGGLIFLPLIVWFSNSFLETSIVPFIVLFFLASLTAVSLVRAENIEEDRSGTAATLNTRWFVVVFGAALAVVLGGGVLGALIAGDSLFIVMAWLSPLWRALQFGATVTGVTLINLASPALEVFALLVQFLAGILAGILGLLSDGLRQTGILENLAPPVIPTPTATVDVAGSQITGKALTIFIMLGLVALVTLTLARTYRQAIFAARASERSRTIEGDEDKPGLGRRVLERLGLFRQWRAAASIRRFYRLMCQAAASAGFPRLGVETPYEYLATLARVWPEHTAESGLITEAFVQVRYGEVPETAEELEVIRSAWQRLDSVEPYRRPVVAEQGPTLQKSE